MNLLSFLLHLLKLIFHPFPHRSHSPAPTSNLSPIPPSNTSPILPTLSPSSSESLSSPTPTVSLPIIRKSSRIKHQPTKLADFVVDLPTMHHSTSPIESTSHSFNTFTSPIFSTYQAEHLASLANVLSTHEPANYKQASQDSRWIDAMQTELAALEHNQT